MGYNTTINAGGGVIESFRRYFINYFKWLVVVVSLADCKKPYNPPLSSTTGSYLVVEGVINGGSDSTFIKLSRTVKLNAKNSVNPELHAIVVVQGDQNVSYPLTEMGNGNYACGGLNLDNTHNYRLSIQTTNNEKYQSDYEPVLNSPPIDSVSYDTKGTLSGPGLNIYVSTHDPSNKTTYYRWDYQETWTIRTAFLSSFKSNGDTVLERDLINDNIYQCWLSDTSNVIVLGSAAKLSANVIAKNPITSVVSTDEKLKYEYSIIVRQYALSANAYNFYTNLKKNTEDLGSIFDAEPSEISGNIHCVTNPAEPVIGYMSVGGVTSQRIFISNRRLPAWVATTPYSNCVLSTDPFDPRTACCYYDIVNQYGKEENQVDLYINYDIGMDTDPLIPVDPIATPGGPIIGFTASIRECVDCTLRGTNKQPAFWKTD